MKISVVCPFFNEAPIIEHAAIQMIKNVKRLQLDWEFIAVNDGSTDNSLEIIKSVFKNEENASVVSYEFNQGRGYALKTGIDKALGDLIITTEMDLSWGDNIIKDIIEAFKVNPQLEMVIASPHLKGGGYKNVPFKRVWLSKIGNLIIRFLFTKDITMNTGMTRGYRRETIQSLRIDEKGKEFHLEVLLKLTSLGTQIDEVPAILEWRDQNISNDKPVQRKSSSKIRKLIFSHLNFAIFANPIRYFWGICLLCEFAGVGFIGTVVYLYFIGELAVNLGIAGIMLILFGLLFFGFGVITSQNNKILTELWRNNKK